MTSAKVQKKRVVNTGILVSEDFRLKRTKNYEILKQSIETTSFGQNAEVFIFLHNNNKSEIWKKIEKVWYLKKERKSWEFEKKRE